MKNQQLLITTWSPILDHCSFASFLKKSFSQICVILLFLFLSLYLAEFPILLTENLIEVCCVVSVSQPGTLIVASSSSQEETQEASVCMPSTQHMQKALLVTALELLDKATKQRHLATFSLPLKDFLITGLKLHILWASLEVILLSSSL